MNVFSLAADTFGGSESAPIWTPQDKQRIATNLAEEAGETLFGGAVGGGKSYWLVSYFGEEMERHPGNRGVIFRRVFPSLERTIVPLAKSLFHGRASWNGSSKTFTWPNGSVLQLAHLQHADTVRDHQGAEYGLIGFEELTEFLQSQYEFMLTRLRSPADGIRPHVVATTNPGGTGHKWVKRRFIKPDMSDVTEGHDRPEPYEVWTPRATVQNPAPETRVFVPSTVEDNPALLRRDPNYLNRVLGAISDKGERAALSAGDWDAIDSVEGALWEQSHLDDGRVQRVRDIDLVRKAVALDPSDGDADKSDAFGVCAGGVGLDGVGYVQYSGGWFGKPRDLAKRAVKIYHETNADVLFIEKNHGGVWLPAVIHDVDPYVNIQMVWASHGKKTRAEPIASLFEPDHDHRMTYRARMVGEHTKLEEELTTYTGAPGEVSPNELDAMVWLLHGLLKTNQSMSQGQAADNRLHGRR